MTFDREPDLDNANVGMPERSFRNNSVFIGSYQIGSFLFYFLFLQTEVKQISVRNGQTSGERLLSCMLRWEPVLRGERKV